MKRIIASFFLFCILSIASTAKTLEFMGIPIKGSISSFQTKLLKKGVKVSEATNVFPIGTRVFEGVFAGERSNIFVYYDSKTKEVWKCQVAILTSQNEEDALYEWNYFKDLLLEKYHGMVTVAEEDVEKPRDIILFFFENPELDGSKLYGAIRLYLEEFNIDDLSLSGYTLKIEYENTENKYYSKEDKLKDL